MHRLSIILTLLAAWLGCAAGNVDAYTRNALKMSRSDYSRKAPARGDDAADSNETAPRIYRPAIIELDPDDIESGIDRLVELGAVIFNHRDELLLACLPVDVFGDDDYSQIPNSVRQISMQRPASPTLVKSREMLGVDAVHTGTFGTPYGQTYHAFDGRGVVVGLCDNGIDPTHIAFDGRMELFTVYNDTLATCRRSVGHAQAATDGADTPNGTHGTHVANILAGGFTSLPYHGIAPGATLAASASILYDVGILAGVEDIIDYAKSVGQPAVINLSLGSNNGPHDGTDLFTDYLDRCGQDAAIVLSAGNDGWGYGVISHTFTEDKPMITTSLQTNLGWDGFEMYGQVDAWSTNGRGFETRVSVYDAQAKAYVYRSPWIAPVGEATTWDIDSTDDEEFAHYYKGGMALSAEVARRNGRACSVFDFDAKSLGKLEGTPWSRYYLVLDYRGEPGVHIDIHADGAYSYFAQNFVLEAIAGSSLQSVSNMACGRNTTCVGAIVSQNHVDLLNGGASDWDMQESNIAEFSSYGTLNDGRTLPHIAAPGCQVISAASTPFVAAHADAPDIVAYSDGYYWYSESGTSMASPAVAGVYALWLQADPTLSPIELRELAVSTARRDFDDIDDPRWGAGCIDAAAGLHTLLQRNTVGNIAADTIDDTVIRIVGTTIVATTLSGAAPQIRIYDLQGRQYPALRGDDSTTATLSPGIYIIHTPSTSHKITIR